jgi:flagellar basal-body rod modification protein FlgD
MSSINQIIPSAASRVASALAPKTAPVTSKDTSATSPSGDPSNSTITSDDFLTLLVSELKNQDPTQPTDPNSYIQQLVGVNSLEQLIQINQGLSSIENGTTTSATGN